MTDLALSPSELAVPRREVSPLARAWQSLRRDRAALFGLTMIVIVVAMALFAPLLAPHDP
ncbi:MAG: hypothetical protein KDD83_23790, partial [Caldilineaceae bacterium]|nr:hypothetical protein [Caldilineaceae bacterium]